MMRRLLVSFAAAVLVAPAALAQRVERPRGPQAADSLIALAQHTARLGDTSRALELLEVATKAAPEYAPAFYQRGVLLSRASRLGFGDVMQRRSAGNQLERALQLDPDNPRYLVELGRLRLKTPFLRIDAERLFSRALKAAQRSGQSRDVADVNWELGQIFERRYLSTAHRRQWTSIGLGVDMQAAMNDFRYTRDLFQIYTAPIPDVGELDRRKAEEHYRTALGADPAHEGAALGLLGILADEERNEEMLKVARDVGERVPRSARLRMAQGYALHHLDRDDEAEAVFARALALLDSAERRDMTRLEQVVREDDAKRMAGLSPEARAASDSLFWDLADPIRLTPTNEARVEFLSRVTFADLRYSSAEFGQKGWKTDRGIIMVRYGPPPQVATFPPEVTSGTLEPDALARVTTVWWYPVTNMRFVFVGPPAMNYAFFGGDFRFYAENAREVAPLRFDNVLSHRVDSVPVQVARFRGADGTVDVSVFADLPTRRMLREVDVAQALLETALFVTDGARRGIVTARDSSIVRATGRDSVTPRTWRRSLKPGSYVYRVEARQPASGKAARALGGVEARDFPAGTFGLSDVLVARRIEPKPRVETIRSRDDMLVIPNASLTFAPRDTAHLYWEAYGLERDSTGNARVRVELALNLTRMDRGRDPVMRVIGGLADVAGLTAEGDDRVVLRYERAVAVDAADRQANYLALDLGDAPFGDYLLEVTVTDLVSGKKQTQRRALTVPRP